MKKLSITVSTLVLTSSAFAQVQTAKTNYIRDARIQLEKENEEKILEMLENQRLQEERARMARFSQVSFSVAPEPAQTYVVPTQTVQPVTVETTQTF